MPLSLNMPVWTVTDSQCVYRDRGWRGKEREDIGRLMGRQDRRRMSPGASGPAMTCQGSDPPRWRYAVVRCVSVRRWP
ncbi:hypothetical protein CHELA41_24167 [Hyphomicrobiales bacterium]|nr:hypothetical protein CHELA41_24167 [Hyphomicrobiales bacterium]